MVIFPLAESQHTWPTTQPRSELNQGLESPDQRSSRQIAACTVHKMGQTRRIRCRVEFETLSLGRVCGSRVYHVGYLHVGIRCSIDSTAYSEKIYPQLYPQLRFKAF